MSLPSLANSNARENFSIFFKRSEFLFLIKGGETTDIFIFVLLKSLFFW